MLSRPIKNSEIAEMRRNGFPGMTTILHEHILALDGLANHRSNLVDFPKQPGEFHPRFVS